MAKENSILPRGKRRMTEQEVGMQKYIITTYLDNIRALLDWIQETFDSVIFVTAAEKIDIENERRRADEYFKKSKTQGRLA